MRVIVPPSSRLTLMRRNGIASSESPLLASITSASSMILNPSPMCLANVAILCRAQVRVYFDPRNQEGLGRVDLFPPAKVIIALVENVGRARFEFGLTADLDIVDGRRRNLDATRDIVVRLINDVHLHTADTTVPFCPFAHLPQRYWARIRSTEPSRPLLLACVDRPSSPASRRFPRKHQPDAVHWPHDSVERATLPTPKW